MAVVVQPIDASGGVPQYSAQQSRQAFSAHIGGASATRPLGAYSGVRPGTPTTTVVMSGAGSTTWTVGAHAGILDTQTPVAAGPYEYACDGADTGTITAANGSNPRIDVIWVTVNDTVQDGSGLRNATIGYSAGTAAASPSAPTVGQGTPAVPARAMILAQVNVPTSGTGSPTATWVAPYCVAAGGTRPWLTAAALLASTGNYDGQLAWAQDTHAEYVWAAGAWQLLAKVPASWSTYSPSWTGESGGGAVLGTGGAIVGRYEQVGKSVKGVVTMILGTGGSGPAGIYNWSLPPITAALLLGTNVDVPCGVTIFYGGADVTGTALVRYSSGGTRMIGIFHAQTAPAQSANPGTWAAGVRISFFFEYEAA